MYREEKVIDLVITMIEQSNSRMNAINQIDKDGYYVVDAWAVKLAQKEFEMQIKLLDRVVKNFKGSEDIIDITPERQKINKRAT